MVREAVFSILGPEGCRDRIVVDLFSGSGIMAIEALSRGAGAVFCVDSNLRSCRLISANMKRLGLSPARSVYHLTSNRAIEEFAALGHKFDLLFLDPPYARPELGISALEQAAVAGILSADAMAVFEHHHRVKLPSLPDLSIWKERRYGQTAITFYTLAGSGAGM